MGAVMKTDISVVAGSDEVHLVEVEGDLDLDTVQAFQAKLRPLRDATGLRLLLDLGGVAFVDSSGVAALYEASTRAAAVAVVVATGSQVARTLELCGLEAAMPTFASRERALEALG
jgi:anti-sigma B factor antagonist